MTPKQIFDTLQKQFGAQTITVLNDKATDPWIEVAAPQIAEVCRFLKHDPALKFNMLCNLCGVDYFEPDPKLAAKFPYESHIEVVYHLLSLEHRHKVTIKVKVPRWKGDQPGELPEVPTVSGVWAIADWHEREAFDLVGIRFVGHPNLVRILCAEDWVGHPLRKDYDFPLEYHGVRGK